VTVRAYDMLGLDRSGITAITSPGFGTTDRTYSNAVTLANILGVTLREIPISDAVTGISATSATIRRSTT
jgi:NAD+ synthase (glutamine-hydrolysing)